MGWGHLRIFFSRIIGPYLTRVGTNHPWVEWIQVCSNEGDDPCPRRDNSERVKIHWIFFLKIFSKTSRPNSINLGTNYPLVKGIQVCADKWPGPLRRGDNYKNLKIGLGLLEIFFSRTIGPILTRLGTNHFWVKTIQVIFKWRGQSFSKGRYM
jgi:hypothetical protein